MTTKKKKKRQSAGDLKTVASMLITFFQSATVEATKLVGQSSIKVMVIWLYLQLLEFIGRLVRRKKGGVSN